MGVHGLWQLLDSFGVVIQPEDLREKRVAVDASIWIVQFRARVAPGEDVEHKVLEGFLARILKLLFYGIRPVFVFDGVASSSKGAEHHRRRMQQARNAQALLKRRAREIVMAQVAAGTLNIEELKAAMLSHPTDSRSDVSDALPQPIPDAADTAATSPLDLLQASVAAATAAMRDKKLHSSRKRWRNCDKVEGDTTPVPPRPGTSKRRSGRRRRNRRLAPEAVAATTTRHFLSDVSDLLEQRTRQEACVAQNALQHTSTSLFMGPRRAVDADAAADGAVTEAPCSNAGVVWVSGDSDDGAEEGEGDSTDFVSVSDSDSEVQADSPKKLRGRSVSSDDNSGVEEVMVVTDEVASRDATPPPPSLSHQKRTSERSPSATVAALLQSAEVSRFLHAMSASRSPVPVATPTPAEASEPMPVAPALPDGATSSSGHDSQGSSSSSTGTAFTSDDTGSSSEEEEQDEDGEEDDDEEMDFAWQPFTQRLHPSQLLHVPPRSGQQPDPTSCAACSVHPLSCTSAPPPPGAAETEKKEEEEEDIDFTPVKVERKFQLPGKPPAPTVITVSSSGDDERSNVSTAPSVASRPLPPPPPSHNVPANQNSTTAAAATAAAGVTPAPAPAADPSPHCITSTGAARMPRASRPVVPFELVNVVELLDCCGVPFVLSPAEADAQCAYLARHGLVDAVFTEDSDVLVHGATTVLRGFFAQSKSVVAYEQAHLTACGITKTVLVALASLLGCDYTDGVNGIGLVGALEALVVAWTVEEGGGAAGAGGTAAASPSAVLDVLQRWARLIEQPPQSWAEADDVMSVLQFALLQSDMRQWRTLERRACFPEVHAVEAFFDAEVDPDLTPFEWIPPDWQRIRVFAGALGALSSTWLVQRYELARKECLRRDEEAEKARAALVVGQRRLTEFGVQERVRATWAFQKQPPRHTAVLAKLRAVQQIQ